ncbi:hypothetical protein HD554DRAFT_1087240 [Boletus coccyginus]|nr:hypothetical protein HD554DRAFT_1087240 [Boletus coccyginus]
MNMKSRTSPLSNYPRASSRRESALRSIIDHNIFHLLVSHTWQEHIQVNLFMFGLLPVAVSLLASWSRDRTYLPAPNSCTILSRIPLSRLLAVRAAPRQLIAPRLSLLVAIRNPDRIPPPHGEAYYISTSPFSIRSRNVFLQLSPPYTQLGWD